MSDVAIALLFALGASAWIYSKEMHSTGSNTAGSLAVAAGLALFLFLAMLTLLRAIF